MRLQFLPFALLILLGSCKNPSGQSLFTPLPASHSGIHFINEIRDGDTSYSFINEFGYMGGGVGIGDFNNDGLKDIFFTGNQVSSRLYINKGNLVFEDITEKAGVTTSDWATGVSIVDINHDGFDDIYVCVIGKDLMTRSKNLLFINQQNLSFKEQASEYGLADTGFSSQAAFFDFDKDGDLDMYLANYLLTDRNTNSIFPRDLSGRSPANDRLYKNLGDTAAIGHPVFSDISMEAGIREDGYGLSVSISDFNNDGWPDIYVGNDFLSNDLLWLNNRNGSFTNTVSRSMQHQSYSSMGADAADLNNDQRTDLMVLDMLPETNFRKKTSFSFMNYPRYQAERQMGYDPEFMRNVLQLNQGNFNRGDTVLPFFSEIGQLAGVQATDWSWSVLLADFNNDGWKDIHVTNGTGRDFINADFLEFSSSILQSTMSAAERQKAIRKKLTSLDHVKLPNYLFINDKNLQFSDVSKKAGIDQASMSNGAVYVDLDNDGDLDIVTNNINEKAFVFLNNLDQNAEEDHHYLKIKIRGDSLNTKAIGTRITVHTRNATQSQELYPVRGYFSSVDTDLLFGLGSDKLIDSLVVLWPDQQKQIYRNLAADTTLTISRGSELEAAGSAGSSSPTLFTDITGFAGLAFRHTESVFDDYMMQRLLPQKFSQLGPSITVADVNKDGDADFFIGGALSFSGKIFVSQPGGGFKSQDLITGVKMEEDLDCLFLDADGDGDQDLLVTGGDVQYEENSDYYRPRLFLNDGKGSFSLRTEAIPIGVRAIAGCVVAADYDQDGDEDLFIGGRVSRQYPMAPRSYLLQNQGGVFTDVTETVCRDLMHPGMITAALWMDIDNNKIPDLVIAGDWMPLRFFKNEKNRFTEITAATGLAAISGMWRSLTAADIDLDGDLDIIAGNIGLNTDYKASPEQPVELWSADIDNNGTIDPVMFYPIKKRNGEGKDLYPSISRGQLATQVPAIKKKFLLNRDYAAATATDIFKGVEKEKIQKLTCDELRTCYLENTGDGKFKKHVLPVEAQFSPVNAILCEDFDADGFPDLLLAGNEYQMEVMTGRYDASYGLFLKGSGKNKFLPFSPDQSGFRISGDVKDMALITARNGSKMVLAALNNDSLRVFRINW